MRGSEGVGGKRRTNITESTERPENSAKMASFICVCFGLF